MTSMEFFNHEKIAQNQPVIDWGTLDLRHEKVDPTVHKAPTYLLKNQPINQVYRENNLELSNVRVNDQLMPGPFKINMLEKQIKQPFPMQHPFTSHMSYNALFPSYTAPEDPKRGEVQLKCDSMIYDVQTGSRVDDTIINKKTHGFPYRLETQQLQLPTQRRGEWYEDKQYYHVPKPEDQRFYSHPQSIHMPNPRLRVEERSIDMITANVLRNKERQLMQSSHQADYYKDGLGSQAPLNSDDLLEKKAKFEQTGEINENMKPYFKRGGGITHATLVPCDLKSKSVHFQEQPSSYREHEDKNQMLTQCEFDETLMENGKDYWNMPETYKENNPLVQTLAPGSLYRSNTMPELNKGKANESRPSSECKNKLTAEKAKIDRENHDRIQRIGLENRRNDIDLITPDRDLRLLRLKMDELENARGPAKPNQKQSYKQHMDTLYKQEAKYAAERAQLYRTPVFNPYMVKQYIESVKSNPKISANFTSGSANASQNNTILPNDTYEHRPKLFAHKVFGDFEHLKRNPYEQVLTDPTILSTNNIQENGLTHQQTTYGGSYNTKKFLQEYDPVVNKTTLEFLPKDKNELEYQNIVLKSNTDNVALKNYKNGTTPGIDMHTARAEVRINEAKIKEMENSEYPRTVGPISHEPYEQIYCAENAGEMGDGYSKRYYSRVYDSPHVPARGSRFEALKTDLQAMNEYEAKANRDAQANQEYAVNCQNELLKNSAKKEVSHVDRSKDKAARRLTDHTAVQFREQQQPLSTYAANYSSYVRENVEQCPPNTFYKPVEYTETVKQKMRSEATPKNIIELQDKWSKSLANRKHNMKYQSSMPDLRQNNTKGKRRLPNAPNAEQYVA